MIVSSQSYDFLGFGITDDFQWGPGHFICYVRILWVLLKSFILPGSHPVEVEVWNAGFGLRRGVAPVGVCSSEPSRCYFQLLGLVLLGLSLSCRSCRGCGGVVPSPAGGCSHKDCVKIHPLQPHSHLPAF